MPMFVSTRVYYLGRVWAVHVRLFVDSDTLLRSCLSGIPISKLAKILGMEFYNKRQLKTDLASLGIIYDRCWSFYVLL